MCPRALLAGCEGLQILERLLERRQAVIPACRSGGGIGLCMRPPFCYTHQPNRWRLFPGSSAVEQPAVNRLVAGSNPARGAKRNQRLNVKFSSAKKLKIRLGQHTGQQAANFAPCDKMATETHCRQAAILACLDLPGHQRGKPWMSNARFRRLRLKHSP